MFIHTIRLIFLKIQETICNKTGVFLMEDAEKRIKLFHDYGYPSDAIPTLLGNTEKMSCEKLEKMIMPYKEPAVDYPVSFSSRPQR
jgi:hypothetical protein